MIDYLEGFAGGGGWTLGLDPLGGYTLVCAIDYEPSAVKNHKANFPLADHFCHNMMETHPRIYPNTSVLVMSPPCTNHSKAKGEKRPVSKEQTDPTDPTTLEADKSRALMEQVIHYTREHRYEMIFVENVPEVHKWDGFERWLTEMESMGYSHKLLYLNSKFFGVPQSRDRFYAVFWAAGIDAPDLEFTPEAHCSHCNKTVLAYQSWKEGRSWGSYGANGQYWYRCPICNYIVDPKIVPASTIIDTENLGIKIKDRKKPLCDKTMNRIRNGIARLGREHLQMGISYYSRENTEFPLTESLPTVTAGGNRHALLTLPRLVPQHVSYYYGSSVDGQPTTMNEPLWTIPTRLRQALITPSMHSDDLEEIVQNSYFRMLTLDELRKGMGFPNSYIFDKDLTQKERLTILGNAVTPPLITWLGLQCAPSLVSR